MHEDKDPVANVLQALKAQKWPGGSQDDKLEERLMQEYDRSSRSSGSYRRRVWIVAMSVLLLGGAGFAVAGGIDVVRSWFIHATLVGPDGEVTEATLEVVPDENGRATFTLPDGGEATVVMQSEGDGDDAQTQLTVTLDGTSATQGTITIEAGGEAQEADSDE